MSILVSIRSVVFIQGRLTDGAVVRAGSRLVVGAIVGAAVGAIVGAIVGAMVGATVEVLGGAIVVDGIGARVVVKTNAGTSVVGSRMVYCSVVRESSLEARLG